MVISVTFSRKALTVTPCHDPFVQNNTFVTFLNKSCTLSSVNYQIVNSFTPVTSHLVNHLFTLFEQNYFSHFCTIFEFHVRKACVHRAQKVWCTPMGPFCNVPVQHPSWNVGRLCEKVYIHNIKVFVYTVIFLSVVSKNICLSPWFSP